VAHTRTRTNAVYISFFRRKKTKNKTRTRFRGIIRVTFKRESTAVIFSKRDTLSLVTTSVCVAIIEI